VRLYKAAFHAPRRPTPDKAIEQYVNLTTADEGRDAKGSRVKILVGADGDADLAADARVGAAGDELYVKVIFAKPSKRNAPLPTVTGLGDSKTIDQLTTGKVTLGPGGASAAFEVELGLAGGTGCTVSVGVTPEANDQTLSLVTWRRLFYQATRPGTMALPSLARMTTALEELFVRYEKYSEVVFTEGDGPPAGAWFDGPMMGLAAGRCVCIGDHNKAHFHAKFVDTKNPLGVHVLVCHAQFDGGVGKAQLVNLASIKVKKSSAKITFPPDGCLFFGLGAFLLRAAVVQFWYPLVTPWRAMALVGALVAVLFTLWARARGGAAVQPAHLAGACLSAFVAAGLLAMPIVYLMNGIFDRSAPTPRIVRVVRAAPRGSTVRIELPSEAIEVLLPVVIGRVQTGDTFTLSVADGALGLPWCRLDAIRTPRDGPVPARVGR